MEVLVWPLAGVAVCLTWVVVRLRRALRRETRIRIEMMPSLSNYEVGQIVWELEKLKKTHALQTEALEMALAEIEALKQPGTGLAVFSYDPLVWEI